MQLECRGRFADSSHIVRTALVRRTIGPLVLAAALASSSTPAAAHHTVEGNLVGIHADDFAAGRSTTSWRLQRDGDSLPLLPTSLPALDPDGTRVQVRGEEAAGQLTGSVSAEAPLAAPALGPRKLAVIMINFTSDKSTPWTASEVRQHVFTASDSASALYREESYGRVWFTGKSGNLDGDVYGWYTLGTPAGGCPYLNWGTAARQAAAADGFRVQDYQHVMYVFPAQSSCGWAGLAYMPGVASWINGDLAVRVTAHELGHNLGLNHAGSYDCGDATIADSCTVSEYGDPYDVMGAYGDRHHHGWHLQQLGFLSSSNVKTITDPGTYTMGSALYETPGPTTLRIPRRRASDGSVLDWYYLEIRQSGLVFDDFDPGDFVVGGVSIRLVDDPSNSTVSRLLDANPTSGGIGNAALAPGETFADGAIRVTTAAAALGVATVDVSLGAAPAADTQLPSAPDGLRHTLVTGGLRLAWNPSSDDSGVARYVVLRDGIQIGTSGGPAFDDLSVAPGWHVYTVYAEDVAGNRSAASAPYAVSVPSPTPIASGTASAADRTAPRVRLGRRRLRAGLLLLHARASDDRRVARIELFIDGRRRKALTAASLRYRWNTRRARRGGHRVMARAVDASGNVASARLRLITRR
jgi:hypothetical protein